MNNAEAADLDAAQAEPKQVAIKSPHNVKPAPLSNQNEPKVSKSTVNKLMEQYAHMNKDVESAMVDIREKKLASHEMKNMFKGYALIDTNAVESEHVRHEQIREVIVKKTVPPSNEDTESEITPDQQSYDPHKPLMNIRSHFETKKIRDTE